MRKQADKKPSLKKAFSEERITDPYALYMREVGGIDLLEPEQEKALGKRIYDAKTAMTELVARLPATAKAIIPVLYALSQDPEATIVHEIDVDATHALVMGEEEKLSRSKKQEDLLPHLQGMARELLKNEERREKAWKGLLKGENEDALKSYQEILSRQAAILSTVILARELRDDLVASVVGRYGREPDEKIEEFPQSLTAGMRENMVAAHKAFIESRNEMMEANLRLVVAVSRKYLTRGVPRMDLIEDGNLGLMVAAEKFDYRREARFATYAWRWISLYMDQSSASRNNIVHIPTDVSSNIAKVSSVRHSLREQFGREPTVEEISVETGFNKDKVRKLDLLRQSNVYAASSEKNDDASEGARYFEKIIGSGDILMPDESADELVVRRELEKYISKLPHKQRNIILSRFGLNEWGTESTLAEIAKSSGVTGEAVRQQEAKAIKSLAVLAVPLREYVVN